MKFLFTAMSALAVVLCSGASFATNFCPVAEIPKANYNAANTEFNSETFSDVSEYLNGDELLVLNLEPGKSLIASEPQGQNVFESYSSLPERIQPPGERLFIFSPHNLRWAAYDEEGYQVATGKANGGAAYCAELGKPCQTPTGVFRVQSKGDASCISRKFPLGVGGAPMPYCMHFGGGFAIHGSPYISNNNTSHGCIRVHTPAAAWLHHYFMKPGTKVMVLPY